MAITDNLLTPNPYSRPQIKMQAIQGVVVHWVANPGSTAIANRNYFNNLASGGRYASAHYIVGLDGEIVRCIPETELAYHAERANQKYIGVECCHPNASGKFNDKTYAALIALTADILTRHGVREIKRHYDITGKSCPKWFVDDPVAFDDFKKEVYVTMEGNTVKEITTVDEAIAVLIKKDIINGAEYWLTAVKCVMFLDGLLIKFANFVSQTTF